MYFDPFSAFLVNLIADGIVVAGEKSRGSSASEYDQQCVKQRNEFLNADIRQLKNKFGLRLPELAFESIQRSISVTKDSFAMRYANGQIVIDLDNQEYIVALLEECSKSYSQYSHDSAKQKAEWFKNASIEARRRMEICAKELEATRIREAKQRENEQYISFIFMVIGIMIFFAFLILIFS